MITQDIIQQQNQELQRWSVKVVRKLKTDTSRFTKGKTGMVIRGKGTPSAHREDKLTSSLGYKTYYDYGLAIGMGVKLERHGVFVHKGVGRGHIMVGGMVIRGVKSSSAVAYAKNKNRESKGYQLHTGSINRHPVEWFNPTLNLMVPQLADRIAEINADAVVNSDQMMIK